MIDKKKAIAFPILCIPILAIIIIGTGIFEGAFQKAPSNVLEKVVITSSDGESFEYADSEILELYSDIIENSSSVSSPQIADNAHTFTVRYNGTVEQDEYYFTMNASDTANCVFKNLNGEYFSIEKEDAYNLLLRNEFASVYETDNISDLTFSYGEVLQNVSASSFSWNYKRVDGEYAPDGSKSNEATSPVRVKIPNSASFDMYFDKVPDYVSLTAKDGNNEIYKGEFAGFATALNFSTDKLLNLTVEAKWYESENADSYGDALYNFELLYDVPATYSLVDKRLKQGEFTVIRVANGLYDDSITASSNIMDGETRIFTESGKQYIYVPISVNATPGKHNIIVNAPEGSVNLSFEVVKNDFPSKNGVFTAEVIQRNTSDARKEYLDTITGLKHSGKILWNGKFTAPVAGTVQASFGTKIQITGINDPMVSTGIYYSAANGTAVNAANSGVVVYAGTSDYMGNAVIIDHGAGVMSYYMNLGTITCNVGDTVRNGGAIGTIGTSGVTPFTDTLLYANSVDGYFVNPETQIKYGISF